MKKIPWLRWGIPFALLLLLLEYSWELFSTDWTYSLARLPSVILFIVASAAGISIYLPRRYKMK